MAFRKSIMKFILVVIGLQCLWMSSAGAATFYPVTGIVKNAPVTVPLTAGEISQTNSTVAFVFRDAPGLIQSSTPGFAVSTYVFDGAKTSFSTTDFTNAVSVSDFNGGVNLATDPELFVFVAYHSINVIEATARAATLTHVTDETLPGAIAFSNFGYAGISEQPVMLELFYVQGRLQAWIQYEGNDITTFYNNICWTINGGAESCFGPGTGPSSQEFTILDDADGDFAQFPGDITIVLTDKLTNRSETVVTSKAALDAGIAASPALTLSNYSPSQEGNINLTVSGGADQVDNYRVHFELLNSSAGVIGNINVAADSGPRFFVTRESVAGTDTLQIDLRAVLEDFEQTALIGQLGSIRLYQYETDKYDASGKISLKNLTSQNLNASFTAPMITALNQPANNFITPAQPFTAETLANKTLYSVSFDSSDGISPVQTCIVEMVFGANTMTQNEWVYNGPDNWTPGCNENFGIYIDRPWFIVNGVLFFQGSESNPIVLNGTTAGGYNITSIHGSEPLYVSRAKVEQIIATNLQATLESSQLFRARRDGVNGEPLAEPVLETFIFANGTMFFSSSLDSGTSSYQVINKTAIFDGVDRHPLVDIQPGYIEFADFFDSGAFEGTTRLYFESGAALADPVGDIATIFPGTGGYLTPSLGNEFLVLDTVLNTMTLDGSFNGETYFVPIQGTQSFDSNEGFSLVDKDATFVLPATSIGESGGAANSVFVNGRHFMLWSDDTIGGVRGQFFFPSGNPDTSINGGQAIQVASGVPGGNQVGTVARFGLASDGASGLLIAGSTNLDNVNYTIWAQRMTSTGVAVGGQITLGNAQSSRAIDNAAYGNGQYLVAWSEGLVVKAGFIDPTTGAVTPATVYTSPAVSVDVTFVEAIGNLFAVAWQETYSGSIVQSRYAILDSDGVVTRTTEVGSGGDVQFPVIATSDTASLISWTQGSNSGAGMVMGQFIENQNGILSGTPFQISADGATQAYIGGFTLGQNGLGDPQWLATYMRGAQQFSGDVDIYARLIDVPAVVPIPFSVNRLSGNTYYAPFQSGQLLCRTEFSFHATNQTLSVIERNLQGGVWVEGCNGSFTLTDTPYSIVDGNIVIQGFETHPFTLVGRSTGVIMVAEPSETTAGSFNVGPWYLAEASLQAVLDANLPFLLEGQTLYRVRDDQTVESATFSGNTVMITQNAIPSFLSVSYSGNEMTIDGPGGSVRLPLMFVDQSYLEFSSFDPTNNQFTGTSRFFYSEADALAFAQGLPIPQAPVLSAIPHVRINEGAILHLNDATMNLAQYVTDADSPANEIQFQIYNAASLDTNFGITIGMSGTDFQTRTDNSLHAHPLAGTTGRQLVQIQARDAQGKLSDVRSFYLDILANGVQWVVPSVDFFTPTAPAIAPDGSILHGTQSANSASTPFRAINPDGTEKWSISLPSGGDGQFATIVDNGNVILTASDVSTIQSTAILTLSSEGTVVGNISGPGAGFGQTTQIGNTTGFISLVDNASAPSSSNIFNFDGVGSVTNVTSGIPISPTLTGLISHIDSSAPGNGILYTIQSNFVSSTQVIPQRLDGLPMWSAIIDTASDFVNQPALDSAGVLHVPAGNLVRAFNPDGSVKWTYTAAANVVSDIIVGFDDSIYFSTQDGFLRSVNANGALRWAFDAVNSAGSVPSAPAIAADGSIVLTAGEKLYIINDQGVQLSSRTLSSLLTPPAIGQDGRIYVANTGVFIGSTGSGGSAGTDSSSLPFQIFGPEDLNFLYAISGSSPLANTAWPMLGHDPQHSFRAASGAAVNNDLDNDGVPNDQDAFPNDPNESVDTDGDNIGNNADPDDDGDDIPDVNEIAAGLDPLNAADALLDKDGDGLNNLDEFLRGTGIDNPDSDGDGINDGDEVSNNTNPLSDEIPPQISITTPSLGTVGGLPFLKGVATDNGQLVSVTLEISGNDGTGVRAGSNGGAFLSSSASPAEAEINGSDWELSTPFAWQNGVSYNVVATARDAYDNTATASTTFTFDLSSQAYMSLAMAASSASIEQNDSLGVSGRLSRLPQAPVNLSGLTVRIEIVAPDGSKTTRTADVDADGRFALLDAQAITGFTQKGGYLLTARFDGNASFAPAISRPVSVLVGASAGYALIVQGKLPNNEGLASHDKTTDRIYQTLVKRGFEPANIHYLNYDASQQNVNGVPSKQAVRDFIENQLPNKANSVAAPIYLFMVDHGSPNLFHIGDETIGAVELDQWVTTMEGKLSPASLDEDRFLVYGACYSGSFIPEVSGPGRIIVSSAAADEESYKGAQESDGIRVGEYFIEEFLKQLERGNSFKGAFNVATGLTELYTRVSDDRSSSNRYLDRAAQHPLLDDNGDGTGSNFLDDNSADGEASDSRYLGVGVTFATNSALNPADIVAVAQTNYLEAGTNSQTLTLQALDNNDVATAWIEVRLPNKELLAFNGTEQIELDLVRRLMTLNPQTGLFEAVFDGFNDPGMYEIYYYVSDNETDDVSPPRYSRVYKNRAGNSAPSAFGLSSPAAGETTKTVLVFDWQDSQDADGLTYVLEVATDTAFSETSLVFKQEDIQGSVYFADDTAGLPDSATLFWRVTAVDRYGARTPSSETREFTTNNTNGVPGIIHGLVYSNIDFGRLSGVNITTNQAGSRVAVTEFNGQYVLLVDSGDGLTLTVQGDGFSTTQVADVSVSAGRSTEVNIGVAKPTGNVEEPLAQAPVPSTNPPATTPDPQPAPAASSGGGGGGAWPLWLNLVLLGFWFSALLRQSAGNRRR